ncbi:MAG TPA: trypsin-like peptidase domain-containing protein [Nitrosomonas sp.]|nr:trypsin-like peptidase domain-containing protein [Nitrosomonas sp.]HQX13530.1 trypsin-like peptidase domain-containing protein [Nitrosomonas sp.]HRB32916.1 trypsin-like peptidase domain-containing protein [Nitrosomonas sp.]HRB45577.1 trypsin-like peptidase domain-containing protein [Nitrosomonas sp.]HRB77582.1 trypsin-like peptidase domain-containing protein [Nitrosomonas sp.]
MYKHWLIFAQSVTVLLAIFFIVSSLRPDLLSWRPRGELVTIKEASLSSANVNRSDSYAKAAEIAMPAVVNIFTSKEIKEPSHPLLDDPTLRKFFGDPSESKARRRANLGSGVIVSAKGYILTNHHVIEAADEVEIAMIDGRKAKATIIGTDPETDLAVLKIDLKDLPAITFGQSEQARVGDVVLALGNPFGVGQSVTMGIVSALSRSQVGINTFENFIQTDAAINPGNSGGALTDTLGNLIGINTGIYSKTGGSLGIGFAIPVHVAKQVMEQIIESGTVIRGWLGVSMQDMAPELYESLDTDQKTGSLVASVLKDGPADKAGIKPGDLLVAVENKPVKNAAEILYLVAALAPGETVNVTVIRNDERKDISIKVGVRPRQQ